MEAETDNSDNSFQANLVAAKGALEREAISPPAPLSPFQHELHTIWGFPKTEQENDRQKLLDSATSSILASSRGSNKEFLDSSLKEVEAGLQSSIWRPANPVTIEYRLLGMKQDEKERLQTLYKEKHGISLTDAIDHQKFFPETKERLKALLKLTDHPVSKPALELNSKLEELDGLAREQENRSKQAFDPARMRLFPDVAIILGIKLQNAVIMQKLNAEARGLVESLHPELLPSLGVEFKRLFGRDLRDMSRKNKGLEQETVAAFKKVGFY